MKGHPKIDPVNGNDERSRLTKLEINLNRFEDERRLFTLEREKFEREKRQMEQVRFQRLLEFEHKRSMQQLDREKLAVQAAAIALAEIEKQRLAEMEGHRHQHRRSKSKSKSRERSYLSSNETYADDYESSTATSSSSRDNDFNDHDFDQIPFEQPDEPPMNEYSPLIEPNQNQNIIPEIIEPDVEMETIESPKQSLFSRLLFGKAKPTQTNQIPSRKSYLNIRVDDGKPVSFRRIIFVESPLVWCQTRELHQEEWAVMMRLLNRCIANFIILSIFFGMGGLTFRFIEGAFENFYKCGVRRVKRDFVDHLWSTSRDLRFN